MSNWLQKAAEDLGNAVENMPNPSAAEKPQEFTLEEILQDQTFQDNLKWYKQMREMMPIYQNVERYLEKTLEDAGVTNENASELPEDVKVIFNR